MDRKNEPLLALIDYRDKYVQPLIEAALEARLQANDFVLIKSTAPVSLNETTRNLLEWRQYEDIDFERAVQHAGNVIINSYVIRKALIRKHYLSTTISHWMVKNTHSVLKHRVQQSFDFELDFAEFLDEALVEAYELNDSLERNAELEPRDRQWWILKPGMSDRGQGIRLFSTLNDLIAIFEAWEEPEADGDDNLQDAGTMTSQLRHFVAQPYIARPLLFQPPFKSANRKFHIRTYVVAVGALKVFVYKPMLALFAERDYVLPWDSRADDINQDLTGHLTNTCLQTGERQGSVFAFSNLPKKPTSLPETWQDDVSKQVCAVVGDVFEAAARGMLVHFQPLPNAFEIYGLDFLVDEDGCPWLLEVNAFPDFAQTGSDLDALIQGLFEGVIDVAVKPFIGWSGGDKTVSDNMVKVLDIDLGRR